MSNIAEMFGKCLLTMFVVIVLPVLAWADTGIIRIDGAHSYKAVRITPEIYNRSNPDLSDILIFDKEGETVPYFIQNFETNRHEELNKTYTLLPVQHFVKGNDAYFDYFYESGEDKDVLATSISVDTQALTFAKTIELRGGYDGINWDFIQTDKLYRVDGNEKLAISFGEPLKYTYYRFKIVGNVENIKFDGVCLSYNQVNISRDFFAEQTTPKFDIEEKDRYTLVKLYGLKNVRIKEVTLQTESSFKRTVSYAGNKSETLYNLSFGDDFYKDTTLDFDGYGTYEDILEIRIDNGDDKPITIEDITVFYYADEVVFKGEIGSEYKFSFGGSSDLAAPVYDVARYKDLVLKEGYDIVRITDIELAEAAEEYEVKDYSMIFNIVVVIISLLLVFIILTRLKRRKDI